MQSILWDRWFGPQNPATSQEQTTNNPGNDDLLYSIGVLFAPLKQLEQALTTRPIARTVNPNDSHDTDNIQDDVMAMRGPNIIEKPVDKKGTFVHADSRNPKENVKDLTFSPSYSCTIDANTPQSAVSQSDTVVETPSPLASPQGASRIASPVAALPSPKLPTPLQRLPPPAANEAAAAQAQPAAEVYAISVAKERGSAIKDTSLPPTTATPERDHPPPEAMVRNCQSLSLNCCSIASSRCCNSACTSAASSRTAPVSPLILNEGQLLQAVEFLRDVEQEEGIAAHHLTPKFGGKEERKKKGEEESFEHQLVQKFDCAHTKMAYLYQQVSY